MPIRASEFKPLLFTTTLRNPGRAKGLLNILSRYDGLVMTDKLAEEIMGELIRYGLYRPMKGVTEEIAMKWGSKRVSESSPIGEEVLSDNEVKSLIRLNPQDHKEAGFEKGWGSRFATLFDFPKELGFVYYRPKEKIFFSEVGLKLANSVEIKTEGDLIVMTNVNPEIEQQAFLHALAKSQRNNPFVRVLNENVPLILLLEVIKKINADKDFGGAGISKLELPLIIFRKNNDAEELYQMIRSLRKKFGYTPSSEVIIDICINGIMGGTYKKFKPKSIISDYPDEFIRKMRLTGLISLRGGGRFLDINKNELEKVDYILSTYSKYKKYDTEKEYFDYMAETDEILITSTGKKTTVEENNKQLDKRIQLYGRNNIKSELSILSTRGLSKDGVLKYLSNPVRLEFLVSLAIKANYPDVQVIPNYPCDDEGLPTSTAGGHGNQGDIECFENENGILIEVTMAEGRTQTMMEVRPISRHLETFSEKVPKSMCYFIAPSIFSDSNRQIQYVRDIDNLNIVAKNIPDFLEHLEKASQLFLV